MARASATERVWGDIEFLVFLGMGLQQTELIPSLSIYRVRSTAGVFHSPSSSSAFGQ